MKVVLKHLLLGGGLMLAIPILTEAEPSKQEGAMRLRITTDRAAYPVFYPIELTFKVTNTGTTTIKADLSLGFDTDRTEVLVSRDGVEWTRYTCERLRVAREVETEQVLRALRPGETMTDTEVVLYDVALGSYVLREPGEYLIRSAFHYDARDYSKTLHSNVAKIRAVRTDEKDQAALELWKGAPQAKVVQADGTYAHGVAELKELVSRHPKSTYAAAARKYLPKRTAEVLFEEDARLGREVTYEFRQMTTLEQALSVLAKQTGVPLEIDRGLTKRSVTSQRISCPLREAMIRLSVHRSAWRRDGDGYRLVPAE